MSNKKIILTIYNDDYVAKFRDERIFGGVGHDKINAAAGNDKVHGGHDNDTLDGGAGNDTLYGEDGDDRIIASAGNDSAEGGIGNDTFVVNIADEGTLEIGDFARGNDEILVEGLAEAEIDRLVQLAKNGEMDAIKEQLGSRITFSGSSVEWGELFATKTYEYQEPKLRMFVLQ